MSALLDNTPEVDLWAKQVIAQNKYLEVFDAVSVGVAWADAESPNEAPIVPVKPDVLVSMINEEGMPLLIGHDPGRPQGRVVAAAQFKSTAGRRFVAVVMGSYGKRTKLSFSDIGITEMPVGASPKELHPLPPKTELILAVDPHEVGDAHVREFVKDAPINVAQQRLSHNALEASAELIRIAAPYVLLVWNPFVTSIASEAGKDLYKATREYIKSVLTKAASLKNPITAIQSHQDGCEVTFLFRGKDVATTYKAYDLLPEAADQAAKLIAKIKDFSSHAEELVYEYEVECSRWYPIFAVLSDGRIVTDHNILVGLAQLPKGLSLGLVEQRNQPSVMPTNPYSRPQAPTTHSKSYIAKEQLKTATNIFLSGVDDASVITLAGAAGNILHQLVIGERKEPFIEYARRCRQFFTRKTPAKEKFTHEVNERFGINMLKHQALGADDAVEIDLRDCATKALGKAMTDYVKLYGDKEDFVRAYYQWAWKNMNGPSLMKWFEGVPKKARP